MSKPTMAPEPTMEEILASIRRIIAEGDEGAGLEGSVSPLSSGRSAAPEAPPWPHRAGASVDEDDPPGRPDAAAHGAFPAGDPATDGDFREPAEIQSAREDRGDTSARAASHIEDPREPAPVAPDVAAEAADPHDFTCPEPPETAHPPAAAFRNAPVRDDSEGGAGVRQATYPDGAPEGAPSADERRGGSAAPDMAEPLATGTASSAQPGLLSPQSDASVAAAFSRLTDTIFARDSRTLDELAGEMLRPMLKDWLDDNLPVLVERLVREEIERVSRGRR